MSRRTRRGGVNNPSTPAPSLQTYTLRKDDAPPETTHVAVNNAHGFKFFCRWDPECGPGGTYWIQPCPRYSEAYNFCSVWQEAFTFIPLADWPDQTSTPPAKPRERIKPPWEKA